MMKQFLVGIMLLLTLQIFAQRDTVMGGITYHFAAGGDTGTAWIQKIIVKKNVQKFSGRYFEFYTDGKLKTSGYYKHGKRSEQWKRFYSSGQLMETGYFDDGYKSDLWQTFYENGKMSWKGSFFKDIRSGFWRYYYEDGKLKAMTRYRIHTEKATRKAKAGAKGLSFQKNVEITYIVSPTDSLVEYYPDGKLRTRIIYGKEGGRNGTVDYYYENGQKNMHGEYANGIQTGDWSWYCPDGSTWKEEHFSFLAHGTSQSPEPKQECSQLSPWMKWEVERIVL